MCTNAVLYDVLQRLFLDSFVATSILSKNKTDVSLRDI